MRKSFLPWLACAAIAVVVIPALAWGAPLREARAEHGRERGVHHGRQHFQDVPGRPRDSASRSPGRTVTFTSPVVGTNQGSHNVVFETAHHSSATRPVASPGRPGPGYRRQSRRSRFAQSPGGRATARSTRPASTRSSAQAHGGMEGSCHRDRHGDADADADGDGHADRDARPPPRPRPPGPVQRARHPVGELVAGRGRRRTTNDSSVTVKAGERVTFDFPVGNGNSVHNVRFPNNPTLKYVQTKVSPGYPADTDDPPPMPQFLAHPAGRATASSPRRGPTRSSVPPIR